MGQQSSKVKVTEADRAVLQLKRSKDEIHKFTKRTDVLIRQERNTLKEMIRDDPNYKQNFKVRFLLKRIHYQENLIQKASDQLINLENMVSNIEFKLVEKQFISGLQSGNQILTKLNREFVDIDKLMDDVQEQMDYQNEINDVLSSSIVGVSSYETELDKELQILEDEMKGGNEVHKFPTTENLPSLDNSKEAEPKKEENASQKEESRVAMLA